MAAVAAAVAPKGPGAEDAGAEDALHHARDASSAGESVDIDVEELDILAGGMPDLSSLTKDLQRCAKHEVVRAILDQGVDVRQSSRDIYSKMVEAEMLSVKDYVEEASALQDLHDRILACDGVLAEVEVVLQRFQSDLGSISGQIRALQEQSASLSTRLDNRREAGKRLGSVLESLVVPPGLVQNVTRAEVDEAYVTHLSQLSAKLHALSSRNLPPDAAARRDVEPELNRLRLSAVHRVRAYLLKEFQQLGHGRTNVPVLQNTKLLPLKQLMRFVSDHGPECRDELRQSYVSVRGRTLTRDMGQLLAGIERIRAPPATKADLVGSSGGIMPVLNTLGTQGLGNLFPIGGRHAESQKAGVFRAGSRLKDLTALEEMPLVPFVEIREGRQHPVEALFRTAVALLSDACTSEYLFCLEFFGDADLFDQAAADAIRATEAWVQHTVAECYDLVGLLLMVRANLGMHIAMQRRAVPCLDGLFDRINLLLWPRVKAVLAEHVQSLSPARDNALAQRDPSSHPVTRRVAELVASLYQLCADVGGVDQGRIAGEGQMEMAAQQLESAYLGFLARHQKRLSPSDGATFRVNNLDTFTSVLREVGTDKDQLGFGHSGRQALQRLQRLQDDAVSDLGLFALRTHFGALVSFAENYGLLRAQGQGQGRRAHAGAESHDAPTSDAAEGAPSDPNAADGPQTDGAPDDFKGARNDDEGRVVGRAVPVDEAERVARAFEATWERQVHDLHSELIRRVGNLLTGQAVLKVCMTQLVVFYRAFLAALGASGPKGQELAGRAVKVASILYEIKRLEKPGAGRGGR